MTLPIQAVLFYCSAFAFSIILAACIFLIAISEAFPKIIRHKKEKYFVNPKTGESTAFPSLNDKSSVNLSVIIPAYNEEDRLKPMLEECLEFLESRKNGFKYEVIVVSDGSKDKTVPVANKYCEKYGTDKVRVLELDPNRGKGGAVRLGMLSARGAMLLFADADGATKFSELTKLEASLEDLLKCSYLTDPDKAENLLAVSIGSRAHLEQEAIASRSFFRTILMYGFHFLVWLFAVRKIKDTQCGFKLFTRRAARILFTSLHVERWAFDVELLYIAQKLKIGITEVAVHWTEIDGSKVTPVWSWIQMGLDLGLIWLRHTIGAWKIKTTE